MEMRIKDGSRFGLMAGLVFAAVATRLLPHPPNFTAMSAIALFSGAYFSRRIWGFAVPLAAMLVSDAVLGFSSTLPVVYATFAAIVGLGILMREKRTRVLPVAGAAAASSVLFYLTTNFAVWAMSGMYPKTPAGLVACYVAAIPFFGPTLAGDLFYTAVLFGSFAWVERRFFVFRQVRAA
jgi:uncharacterized protein DUF6580